jgi:hypothetical protein
MSEQCLRIVVFGYLVRGPVGGMAWGSNMNYLAGLEALGHDVYLLEDSGDAPWACWDPHEGMIDTEPSYGLAYAGRALELIGFEDRWAYYDSPRGRWHGPLGQRAIEICRSADLLLDVGGTSPSRDWLHAIPRRVLLDLDPVFTQMRHLTEDSATDAAERYTDFFTVAENFGRDDCSVPDDLLPWQPARSPVFLAAWPIAPPPAPEARFTTVMQWESYRAAERDGVRYGLKADSFGPYMQLPSRVDCPLEMTIGGGPADVLRARRWVLRDPGETCETPATYRDYIRGSRAEFTVAKHGYVVSRSGWFSERSASYLASGRPVVTQETGFSDWMAPGEGVLAFSTIDEASAAIEEINTNYARHCRAAREIAETYFDSRHVLADLLERALNRPPVVAAR